MRLDRIEITKDEVAEFDRNRKIIAIPKDHIKEISLEYDYSEERPIVSIIIGVFLFIIGFVFGLMPVFQLIKKMLENNSTGVFGPFALAIPLLFLGVWFILRVFQKRSFLKVVANSTTRKLSFGKGIEKTTLEKFIKRSCRDLGYNISINATKKH